MVSCCSTYRRRSWIVTALLVRAVAGARLLIQYSTQDATGLAAHSMCELLRTGGTTAQAGVASMNAGYSAADSGVIVGAAIGAYCPEFSGR
jgi:uncharacterized protein DUF732